MPDDPLAIDSERMREMGHAVVDMLVGRIENLRSGPVLRTATRAEMDRRLGDRAPAGPQPFADLLDRLESDVLPFVGHFDHPRFFGYIPGAGTWPAALGDLIASATNIDSGTWREAAGPSQLELTVLDWFRGWIGYPPDAAGVLVSGGSAANLTAIACAREALIGAMSPHVVLYASDQTHSSLARAARHLGFRPDQLRVIATDDAFRLRVDDLSGAIDADAAAGRLPFLVVANAGTTSTGAVDDLGVIAELCRARGLWLHVDGAYGGFGVLSDRGRSVLAGIERADSIALDPHKWLAMPFEVGCLLVRDGAALEGAFELHPEYLQEHDTESQPVNFADRGLQLTRGSRAIKVWLALETFGVDAFREAIDRSMDLALLAQHRIAADERLELVTPASLGVLTFRRRGGVDQSPFEVDRLNARIVADLAASGDVLLTSTTIGGRFAIRLCILNHTSTVEDVEYAIDRVATASLDDRRQAGSPARTATGRGEEAPERAAVQAAIHVPWLDDHGMTTADLRATPAFAEVSEDDARQFLASARFEAHAVGTVITERWSLSRTFYLVRSGRLSVRIDGREVNSLGPGDHLGEIAAIDWGRDFSYGRSATVVVTEDAQLVSVPAGALRDLMSRDPTIDRAVRGVAHVRLAVR